MLVPNLTFLRGQPFPSEEEPGRVPPITLTEDCNRAMQSSPLKDVRCPYPGLRPFQPD